MVFNQGLIQLFLYEDHTAYTRIHLPGRTSAKEGQHIHLLRQGREGLRGSLQIEMDFIVEKNGDVAFAEAKRGSLWSDLL